MKIFAILLVTLVAQSYAHSHSKSSGENFGSLQGSRWSSGNSPSSSEEDFNSRNNQKWSGFNQELEDIFDSSLSSSSSYQQFQSSASRLPQAESFKTKITQRLNRSDALATNSELKRKLIKMADQKLEKCTTPSGEDLDRHCVGRITGQVMQLIAAVEKVNRPTIGHNRRSFDY